MDVPNIRFWGMVVPAGGPHKYSISNDEGLMELLHITNFALVSKATHSKDPVYVRIRPPDSNEAFVVGALFAGRVQSFMTDLVIMPDTEFSHTGKEGDEVHCTGYRSIDIPDEFDDDDETEDDDEEEDDDITALRAYTELNKRGALEGGKGADGEDAMDDEDEEEAAAGATLGKGDRKAEKGKRKREASAEGKAGKKGRAQAGEGPAQPVCDTSLDELQELQNRIDASFEEAKGRKPAGTAGGRKLDKDLSGRQIPRGTNVSKLIKEIEANGAAGGKLKLTAAQEAKRKEQVQQHRRNLDAEAEDAFGLDLGDAEDDDDDEDDDLDDDMDLDDEDDDEDVEEQVMRLLGKSPAGASKATKSAAGAGKQAGDGERKAGKKHAAAPGSTEAAKGGKGKTRAGAPADQSAGKTLAAAAKTPEARTPGSKAQGAKTPAGKTPEAKTPADKTPGAKTPTTATPGAKTPGAKTPGTGTPGKGSQVREALDSGDYAERIVKYLRGEGGRAKVSSIGQNVVKPKGANMRLGKVLDAHPEMFKKVKVEKGDEVCLVNP